MTITIQTQLSVDNKEITVTMSDKVIGNIENLDGKLIELISALQMSFSNELAQEAERLGYQLVLRKAPLFPIPAHL
ncbi:hypothetical protein ACXA18_09735 [Riemerella anatipestifer]|nr:hypothetical protein [Riemerella anatipestifer]